MSVPLSIAAGFAGWIAFVLLIRWVVIPLMRRGPGGDPVQCLLWIGCRIYAALMHRVRFAGFKQLRRDHRPGGLIVIANHTSSVDPVLIQTGCWFKIRWLMAAEMMIPELDWVWEQQEVIPVSRDGGDSRPVRESIRHVRAGGVIGIFPEGRIVSRGAIQPFFTGVGAIVARTGAPVLIAWITGTPVTENLRKAFVMSSRSRVEFVDLMRFEDERDAVRITEALRARLSEASGWPLVDAPAPLDEA